MDPIAMATTGDPIFWAYSGVLLLIGIVLGWLFTRRGWRKRAMEAESRVADLTAAQRRSEREPGPADDSGSTKQADESAKQIEQLQASLKAAETELESLRSAANESTSAAESSDEDKVAAEASAEASASEAADLRMQLSLLQEEFDAATASATADVETARSEAVVITAALAELESELSTAREEAKSAQDALDAVGLAPEEPIEESIIEDATSKDIALKEAYAQVLAAQEQLEACEAANSAAQSDVERMRDEVAVLNAERSDMVQRIAQSRSDAAGDLAMLTTTMLKLKDDAIDEANARIAALTREVESLRSVGDA